MGKHPAEKEQDISISGICFITDGIAKKEAAIQYCSTKQMVADYFTKPLQGALFYKLRDQILGLAPIKAIHGDQRSVLESNPASAANQQSPMKGVGR
jgi:hypothetical protein